MTIRKWFIASFAVVMACSPKGDQEVTDQDADSTVVEQTIDPKEKETVPYQAFKLGTSKYPQGDFINPIDSPVLLSGSFCELRNNHFHGGLDIRTGGTEGYTIRSVADGYVSRIKVSPYGYGKALYITHSNGYTSVYGHLKEFSGAIQEYVKKAQYAKRSYEVEVFPKASELRVKQGDQVALSGNTGGSGGPHLHFEIRDARSRAINPLLFGMQVEDHIPPQIRQVLVYHRDKDHLIREGGYRMKKLKTGGAHLKGQPLRLAPGTYSFGLLTKDFFTDTRYRLGINYCRVRVNGKLLYAYRIEHMEFDKGRYINTHLDPFLKYRTGVNYIRLFKEPFNPYPYYRQEQNGEVWLQAGDTARVSIEVMDYAGMMDSVEMMLVGDSAGSRLPWPFKDVADTAIRISKGRTNHASHGPWKVSIPNTTFYHDFDLKLATKQNEGCLGSALRMHYGYTPLHSHIQVSRELEESMLAYGDKLCAVSYNGKHKVYEGGSVTNGRLHFKTRSFGTYGVWYDNVPPRIVFERLNRKGFRFRISDNLSGVEKYIASVDDQWVLAEFEPKLSLLSGEFPDWIKPGEHEFKLVVIDGKGNRKEYKQTIRL